MFQTSNYKFYKQIDKSTNSQIDKSTNSNLYLTWLLSMWHKFEPCNFFFLNLIQTRVFYHVIHVIMSRTHESDESFTKIEFTPK